ncbi:hypothetical protein [Methylotuvimicrobium buryatense]|uniref:Uncharacterized protein n=1 Tax=Methylotuvimicrobium buryatense TaxID=95641 RepID=A0A4P9UQ18_METBY|nr:hypothetical protein [Methylotuvimicrobium buryatense]QCW82653.1 hypothetical protein EQU24_10700 [Methylotuvimicrobium buryatense]
MNDFNRLSIAVDECFIQREAIQSSAMLIYMLVHRPEMLLFSKLQQKATESVISMCQFPIQSLVGNDNFTLPVSYGNIRDEGL